MVQAYVQANVGYVIQVSDPEGKDLGLELIEQFVNPADGVKTRERVRNQVEAHLFHRFRKTGNSYYVIFEGDIYQAKELVEGRDGIPF